MVFVVFRLVCQSFLSALRPRGFFAHLFETLFSLSGLCRTSLRCTFRQFRLDTSLTCFLLFTLAFLSYEAVVCCLSLSPYSLAFALLFTFLFALAFFLATLLLPMFLLSTCLTAFFITADFFLTGVQTFLFESKLCSPSFPSTRAQLLPRSCTITLKARLSFLFGLAFASFAPLILSLKANALETASSLTRTIARQWVIAPRGWAVRRSVSGIVAGVREFGAKAADAWGGDARGRVSGGGVGRDDDSFRRAAD